MPFRSTPKSLSTIAVGDRAEFTVVIDEALHRSFADLSGDRSPIHLSRAFSADTPFGEPIGYAFMLTALLSRLYGEFLPGGTSVCLKQEGSFLKPYRVGDEITALGEVTHVAEATRIVEITCRMFRNGGEKIFEGAGLVRMEFHEVSATPLYESEGARLYPADFVKGLRDIGVVEGDVVFVHSDITVFGKLATKDRQVLLGGLVEALKQSVGEAGSIVMPTFTYSFCEGESYNLRESPSTTGVLTEYFRRGPGVVRSDHPIFSVACWGKKTRELVEVGTDSFDDHSVFGILHGIDGKIVFLGAPFQSCTFLHHVEQGESVPYRYMKTFTGIITDGSETRKASSTFFVRDLEFDARLDGLGLDRHLTETGMMRRSSVGGGTVMAISAADLFEEGTRLLRDDPLAFLVRAKA